MEERPPRPRLTLDADHGEEGAELLDRARQCGAFDVRVRPLDAGDYLVAGAVIVERKTSVDFAVSLVDGRLFRQAAALASGPYRPIVLIEGPSPARLPDVHPHAIEGAILSLAVMWRLPVIHAPDPRGSLRVLRFLANQVTAASTALPRYGRRPKRPATRRLYVLQGLPGVGPALAERLIRRFGSIERVIAADEAALVQVEGLGAKRAARIRELVRS